MNTQILQEKKESLEQRMRILILQNAREGSVYDKDFLLEVHRVSRQLLSIDQAELHQGRVEKNRALGGLVPTLATRM